MRNITDTYLLANEVAIPCVGFGTWQAKENEAYTSVKAALELGYRHIDTAAAYGNEEEVGRAIADSGIPRDELFITTKLWNDDRGYEQTKEAFATSINKLGIDYLDLYLIHWPNPAKFRQDWQQQNAESWRAMEDLYKEGSIRAIGISNFQIRHIEPLLKTAEIVPHVNQMHLCPGDSQDELVAYCREKNMLLEAYSPLGTGKIFEVPEIQSMAERLGHTIAQICLRWSLQKGFLPLPKSVSPERIRENSQLFDFVLSDADMAKLDSLTGCAGTYNDPDTRPF